MGQCLYPPKADVDRREGNVRFGSEADMRGAKGHVCFGPKADIADEPHVKKAQDASWAFSIIEFKKV